MTLLGSIIAAAVALGVLFALISLSLFWLQRQAGRQFEQKFADANQIIQTGRPPAAWAQKERRQIERLRTLDKEATAMARIGNRAKRRSLNQLHRLTRFLENGRFYDSLETRELMVEQLQAIHEQWLTQPADYFIEP